MGIFFSTYSLKTVLKICVKFWTQTSKTRVDTEFSLKVVACCQDGRECSFTVQDLVELTMYCEEILGLDVCGFNLIW